MELRLLVAARPIGRCGHFVIDAAHKYCLYQFLDITELPEAFYKQQRVQTGTRTELLYDNIDSIMARTVEGALDFLTKLDKAPGIFDERYLGHLVVGMNARMLVLQEMPEWLPMGAAGKYARMFVALLQEVASALRSGETLDWLGCPAIPDQALEAVHIGMVTIEPIWSPTPTKEIMAAIRLISRMTT